MYVKCCKMDNLSCDSIVKIEKWINKHCMCTECQSAFNNLNKHIRNITIERHPKFTYNNLFLTSKMLIKIDLEITKQKILKSDIC